ncbi:RNA polymerase sigma factor for flagellar operon FliA [Scopulibacillus daqui]|uniref:RNA polymerase sigma factor for flagellar operon FliA n=1 Tax=Scopulibacillus daqui TaxID=1469162 RepID=A0ABS2PWE9_9BACL|nr:FliA/WhiG family RNA polymerase sigma factor [Scopulibacillus daqui]MBM7644373.1 RNA polymerase sigma factor for flagellar operon FliA [Scopulibacillus daqui]
MSAPEEEKRYWENWINHRDEEAVNALICMYMPLVNYHVQRISAGIPNNINKDDLKSYGMSGLYDALYKFDITRDLKFDTYASFRIRGAIIDGLRKEDWMPRALREKTKKLDAITEQLEQKYMRHVSLEEVAKEMGISIEEASSIVYESLYSNLVSIDDDLKNSQKEQPAYIIEDKDSVSPDDQLINKETEAELAQKIVELNPKEQIVISLFYYEELTLTEIGKVLGLSTSRISQIHSKALFKLRKSLLNPIA